MVTSAFVHQQRTSADLNATAKVLRDNCEVVIVAGIGGSYPGARAVIEALSNSFTWLQDKKLLLS